MVASYTLSTLHLILKTELLWLDETHDGNHPGFCYSAYLCAGNFKRCQLDQVLILDSARKRHEMKHSAIYLAIENLLRALSRKRLSIVAVIIIGWCLRKLYRRDGRKDDYVLRAYESHYVDPTNLYKFYGSYGNS